MEASTAIPVRPTLRGDHIILRTPCPNDKRDRLAIGRHAEFVRMVGGDAKVVAPLTEDDVERWYAGVCAEPYEWVIEVDGRAGGTVRLHRVEQANRRARFAIGIFDPALWGQGAGTDATRLVLRSAIQATAFFPVHGPPSGAAPPK